MPDVLDWRRDNPADLIRRAAACLRRGDLVVVPTDTMYAVLAHGLQTDAVARLAQLTDAIPAIALADPLEAPDWLPNLDGLGRRLARSCWPGPLALRSAAGVEAGLVQRLPAEVRDQLVRDGLLTLRVSGHPALGQIAGNLAGPVVVAELAQAQPEAVLAHVGDRAALVVGDGPAYFSQPASVVRVDGRSWALECEGVLGKEHLAELARCRVLFVCTGNTCRSPLAMALCRQLLGKRLRCTERDLPERGFQVLSAGLAAIMGEAASPEAVDVAREFGASLEGHSSQPLSAELLAQADCLFTMTRGHLRMLQGLKVNFGPPPRILAMDESDVVDPIGCDIEVYRQCAQKIVECLEERLPEMLEA